MTYQLEPIWFAVSNLCESVSKRQKDTFCGRARTKEVSIVACKDLFALTHMWLRPCAFMNYVFITYEWWEVKVNLWCTLLHQTEKTSLTTFLRENVYFDLSSLIETVHHCHVLMNSKKHAFLYV